MTPSVRKYGRFLLLPVNDAKEALCVWPSGAHDVQEAKNLSSFLKKLSCKYLIIIDGEEEISSSESSLRRLLKPFENKRTGMIYSDFILHDGNNLIKHPLIDYQPGSIRDDFKFGHLLLLSCEAVKSVLQKYGLPPSDTDAAFYDLRLKISTDHKIVRVPEILYTVSTEKQKKIKKSGRQTEAHFAYVAKENLIRQKKLENIATDHLKRMGYIYLHVQKA